MKVEKLPKVIDTFSGPMKVRAWGVLERTGQLLADLGTNGIPGNGYRDRPSWYAVDDDLFPRQSLAELYRGEGDVIRIIKYFDGWVPRTNCGCI